ncbi:MAG TPA: zeta toxin family protein [Methanosarcina sp.]|nr:zeta toxin family protein [Methanosarcina sp.]
MHLFEIFQPTIDEGINDPGIFKAIFLAGPPGAGKNTIIQKLGLQSYGLKLQDIDHTLALLKKFNPNYQSSLDVTLRRQSLFQQQMLGLIINTTGRDSQHLMSLNKNLKEVGYDTFMLFVDVDEETALARIQNRPKFATDPRDVGRKVDLDYFYQALDASKKNSSFYALSFGDQFAYIDNTSPNSPDIAQANKKLLAS